MVHCSSKQQIPFIRFLSAPYPALRAARVLHPIPAFWGWSWGAIWTSHSSVTTQRQTTICTHMDTNRQEEQRRLWEETNDFLARCLEMPSQEHVFPSQNRFNALLPLPTMDLSVMRGMSLKQNKTAIVQQYFLFSPLLLPVPCELPVPCTTVFCP